MIVGTIGLSCTYGNLLVHRLATGPAELTPLICLHPAPFDGTYFAEFAQRFNGERRVLAPDYPGYGGSDAPPSQPSIDDYAAALLQVLDELTTGKVHLLGFHTGCLVACEMARQQSQHVADLVLIDIPYFNGDEQCEKYRQSVTDQPDSWGFGAAFSYPCAERFAAVNNRALVIASGSNLAVPTHDAAAALTRAHLKNCPEVTRPALKNGGERFAQLIRAFLHD
jgi:pimeloyl-ACP methyl ester carboxylesterase